MKLPLRPGKKRGGSGLKKASAEGRTIVFIDESGLSLQPHRVRTWARRGQTPPLEFAFNWKRLSAIAGLTWWSYFFTLHPGSIKSPQVVEFLRHLLEHIGGKLLIIWDGAPIHRSNLVRKNAEVQGDRLHLEFLPSYAPELNPVEYLWGYFKQHALPNFCPKELWQLSHAATRCLRPIRRRRKLTASFWKQAELFY